MGGRFLLTPRPVSERSINHILNSQTQQTACTGILLVGSRAGAVVREVVALSVSRVSPFVPV